MKKIFTLIFLAISSVSYAEETIIQPIGPINFNGDASIAYFRGSLKWGAPGCPNATYAQILANVPGRKEMLSIALAAKMANKPVQFWGTCSPDKDYFNAMYIIVE